MPRKKWGEKSIVYLGYGNEWSPESLWTTGVGGSETALINLAKNWQKMGYEVTVYAASEGVYDGVQYHRLEDFDPEDEFNILILWRVCFDRLKTKIRARKIMFDFHDLLSSDDLKGDLSQVDHFFVKSQFQKDFFLTHENTKELNLPEEKFVVIPNGVEIPSDIKIEKSDTPRVIYSSYYNRGLDLLLSIAWPIIIQEIPDAELHIFYGWDAYEMQHGKDNFTGAVNFLMFQPGVHHHGRVPQHELIEEKAKSHLHYYVTYFPEVDCISVRESIAVKCLPIMSDYAALKEKPYGIHIPGNPQLQETHEIAARKTIELLKNPKLIEPYVENVHYETWDEVAKEWIKYFD